MAQHHLSSAFISGYISHGWPLKHIKVIKALICWWFDHMSQSMTHWNVHPSCLLDNHILTKSTSLGMSQMIRYMTMYRRLYIYTWYIYIYIYTYIMCVIYTHSVYIYIYIFVYNYMYICTMVAITPSGNSLRGYISARLGPGTSSMGAVIFQGWPEGFLRLPSVVSCLKNPSNYRYL